MIEPVIISLLAIVAGAVLGSYVTTAALRRVGGEHSTTGRSRCDRCGVALGWLETTPVLAFALRRGACRDCGGRIDRAHLVGELAGAVGGLLVAQIASAIDALLIGLLGLVLLAASVVDARTLKLPDLLTAAAGGLCIVLAWRGGVNALIFGLAAVLLSFAVLSLVRLGSATAARGHGLGFGDVKLVTVMAVWLGASTPWAIVVASCLGLIVSAVVRPADGRIAFGPMIAVASWSVGVLGEIGWLPTRI